MEELNPPVNENHSANPFAKDTPLGLIPVYSMREPNESVLLYEGDMEIKYASQEVQARGRGIVHLKWVPSIQIEFEISNAKPVTSSVDFFDALENHDELSLTLLDTGISSACSLFEVSQHFDSYGLVGELKRTIIGDSNATLKYLLFHLVNFSDFTGDNILYVLNSASDYRWSEYRGRLTFEAGCWRVTIDAVENQCELFRNLKNRNGYAFTHTAKLEKIGNIDETFSPNEAEEVLSTLLFFLSFARGIYSTPFLPVGFDSNDKKVWELWEIWMVDFWTYVHSWFSANQHNPESLAEIFPSFIDKWNNPNWENPLRWSINWYVESNRGGGTPDGRIIWVQSALELLSWTYFVTEGRMSKSKFKDENTEAKIRKLLEELNIQTSFSIIPARLQNFEQFIQEQTLKGNEFKDYLQAFIRVRNNITHPEKRFEPSFEAKIQALQLGLWYLELTLLALFKYQGRYANRLEKMNLEPVPWASVNEKG